MYHTNTYGWLKLVIFYFFNVNIIYYIHYDIEFLIRMYSISKYREGEEGAVLSLSGGGFHMVAR